MRGCMPPRAARPSARPLAARLLGPLALGLFLLAATAGAQQPAPGSTPAPAGNQRLADPAGSPYRIANGLARASFTRAGDDLFLTRLEGLAAGVAIPFGKGRSMWLVELRIDPRQSSNAAYDLDVEPGDLPLRSARTVAFPAGTYTGEPGGTRLTARWRGTVPRVAGAPGADPAITVAAHWILFQGQDTLEASIDVTIDNPGATLYRLWLTRFPRHEIPSLKSAPRSDRLALGKLGGFLYGDPIDYQGASGERFVFTLDPNHLALPISLDAAGLGPYAVPACAYYDTVTGNGLYYANDDYLGYLKGIYWNPDPANGALTLETVQYPPGDIFAMTAYSSPYRVQLAAMRGDWIDAAVKYRAQYRTYPWYPGPTGSSSNATMPQEMKDVPVFGELVAGNGYDPPTSGDLSQAQSDLAFWNSWFGVPIPFLMLNRFPVDPSTEITLAGGYTLNPAMQSFVASTQAAGNRSALLGISEKLYITPAMSQPGSKAIVCCLHPTYCAAIEPALQQMNDENTALLLPQAPPGGLGIICSKGKGLPSSQGGTGVDWPAWFSSLNGSMASQLGAIGGQTWVSTGPSPGWCFSTAHAHPPGFGSWYAQGWIATVAAASASSGTFPFPAGMELSSSFFSPVVPFQSDVSFAYSFDLVHGLICKVAGGPGTCGASPCQVWEETSYYGAPIWPIPMLPMIADNIRYGDVYVPQYQILPYTRLEPASDLTVQYFEPFPAISGSLACWNLSIRVLARQGLIPLLNARMLDPNDVLNPGSDPAKLAAKDLMEFQRGLLGFLTSGDLSDFHAGTLERPPRVQITSAPEGFVLPDATIQTYLPALWTRMHAGPPAGFHFPGNGDLDFTKYAPILIPMTYVVAYGDAWFVPGPEEVPSWLPHGMYRNWQATDLVLLMANPWGVGHVSAGGGPAVPMNPFTFDFADPPTSPPNTYTYTFPFDPADYAGFPQSYRFSETRVDVNGTVLSQGVPQPATGPITVSGTIGPAEFTAWRFTP